ncbi:MAG: DUF1549 domain-containing protein [Blastocatellia bacterium]
MLKRLILLACCALCVYAFTRQGVGAARSASAQSSGSSRRIDFNRDIRPILSDKCFACHGPDAPNRKIRLRLDSEEAAKADLGRGRRAIIPGNVEQSQLVRRITASDEAMRMPPVDSGHKLSQAEIGLLVEWIGQGARWQQHWSFIAPVRPPLPEVKNKDWPRNAIDHFVLARLEQEGLQPSPEADRAALLRRLSFDLTGLPPTLKELDDFINDKSPGAYETLFRRRATGRFPLQIHERRLPRTIHDCGMGLPGVRSERLHRH